MSESSNKKKVPSAAFHGSDKALARAGEAAKKLGEQTGTPVYVFRAGKIIDLMAEKCEDNFPRPSLGNAAKTLIDRPDES